MLWAATLSGFLPALFRSSVFCAKPDKGQSVSAVASSRSFFIVASRYERFYRPLLCIDASSLSRRAAAALCSNLAGGLRKANTSCNHLQKIPPKGDAPWIGLRD